MKSYHVKHRRCFQSELSYAREIANFAIQNKANRSMLSSKYVKHIPLKAAIANQILRKHPVVVDCMNLFGSACVGFNCFCKKAYAPMFLEVCWFGIAFAAMVKHSI